MRRPTLFAYFVAAPLRGSAPDSPITHDRGSLRTVMTRFATREGFHLAQVFVEVDPDAPRTALTSLIEAARYTPIHAVVVPDLSHLGDNLSTRRQTRDAIERATGAPVLTVWVATEPGTGPRRAGSPRQWDAKREDGHRDGHGDQDQDVD